MRSAVDGIYLDGSTHIESGLLEPQTHPANTREQVNRYWPHVLRQQIA
jgi:hypothetical protein